MTAAVLTITPLRPGHSVVTPDESPVDILPTLPIAPIPTFGPYPSYMTKSLHFPPLLNSSSTYPSSDVIYLCAYRFTAQIVGCSSPSPTVYEKVEIVSWLRKLAIELHDNLLKGLAEAFPPAAAPEPSYFRYRSHPYHTPITATGCDTDIAVVDLHEYKGQTLRAANFAHIDRVKSIIVLEDLVKRMVLKAELEAVQKCDGKVC